MALRVPPPEIPVVTFLSPNKLDQGLIEFWNTELASYTPLDVGAPHPNSRQYPNFYLGNQRPLQGDEKWVIRTWVTNETSPDWFNYSLKFAGEDNAFPIFIRTYREPRESYTPRAKATPLNALYKMVLTENGTGYANGAYPTVQFEESAPPPTTVAVAHGVVAPDGSISECVLDFGGEGYQDDVAFTVQSPINGTPASGIAYRQPVSAILINELANLYPEDSPFYGKYLQVIRVYETLPGPTFYGTKFDVDGGIKVVGTTRKLCSEVNASETLVDGVWVKTSRNPTDSDIVCEEVQEIREIPGYLMEDTKFAEDGKIVSVTRAMIKESDIVSEEDWNAGTWTKKYKEDLDGSSVVSWEVVESRDIPGNPIDRTVIDDNGDIMVETRTLVQASTITTVNTVVGNIWTKRFEEPVAGSDIIATRVVQVRETQNELNSFSVTIPDLIPPEFRGVVPITTTGETLIGQASLPTLGTGEIEVEERELDAYTYRRTVSGRPDLELPVTLVNQELTEEYGGGILDVTMTLDLIGNLTIDEGLTVVDSTIRNLGNGLGLKTTKELQDSEWPELLGTEVDPRTGIVIGITKQVVDAGAVGGVTVDGYIDVKPLDKWRSLTIASKLDPATLPSPLTWETTIEHSFPNTLQGAEWLWASANAECCFAFDMTLTLDIDQGYSGPCRGKVTESYTVDPPADVVTITQFFPKAHMVGYAWFFASVDEECGGRCRASAATFSIPPSLHDEITIGGSVILDDGSFTDTLPATDPIGLPAPGTLITKEVNVEQWRFGVFFRRIVEIYVPG